MFSERELDAGASGAVMAIHLDLQRLNERMERALAAWSIQECSGAPIPALGLAATAPAASRVDTPPPTAAPHEAPLPPQGAPIQRLPRRVAEWLLPALRRAREHRQRRIRRAMA